MYYTRVTNFFHISTIARVSSLQYSSRLVVVSSSSFQASSHVTILMSLSIATAPLGTAIES